jgi:hypothetical protein
LTELVGKEADSAVLRRFGRDARPLNPFYDRADAFAADQVLSLGVTQVLRAPFVGGIACRQTTTYARGAQYTRFTTTGH